jgi:hypothetical protein
MRTIYYVLLFAGLLLLLVGVTFLRWLMSKFHLALLAGPQKLPSRGKRVRPA